MAVLRACVILHNMCVEARRDGYVLQMFATALDGEGEKQFGPGSVTYFRWQSKSTLPANASVGTWATTVFRRQADSVTEVEHRRLKLDLIDHICNRCSTVRS